MRHYDAEVDQKKLKFAKEAAEHFNKNPLDVTYTTAGPKNDEYLALRWGMGNDCVLVLKVDEFEEMILYPQFIDREAAALTIEAHEATQEYLNSKKGD